MQPWETGAGRGPPGLGELTWGPTWGRLWARLAHRALQRRQPALHVTDALCEACLLAFQQLLQVADSREELLFVQTVLGRGKNTHHHH